MNKPKSKIRYKKVIVTLLAVVMLLGGCFATFSANGASEETSSVVAAEVLDGIAETPEDLEDSSFPDRAGEELADVLLELEEQEEVPDSQPYTDETEDITSPEELPSLQEVNSSLVEALEQEEIPVLLSGAMLTSLEYIEYSKVLDNIYFRLSTGHSATDYYRKALYGSTAYCVEPGVPLGSAYYNHEVSGETWYRMSLADYWGRFVMTSINGKENENNLYVQLYVWELLGHPVVELSGATVSLSEYQSWKTQIEPCLNAFFTPPSFAGQSITLKADESITLTDTNGSLSYYKLGFNNTNVDVQQVGDTLILTAGVSSYDGPIRFDYDIYTDYKRPMYYWTADGYQDCVTTGVGDPANYQLYLEVIKQGTLALKKTSEDGIVSGLRFNVKSTDGSYNQTFTTDANGLITQDLDIGTYIVSEVGKPDRYVALSSQTVTIKPLETSSVSFKNILKKFNVKVKKVDSATTTAQGGASLAGAVYGVYKDNKLLDTYTTNANGEFTTKNYVCGDGYYIQEITPSPGYLLDDTVYRLDKTAAVNYTVELNSLSLTVKEKIIRGDLKAVKVSDGDMKRLANVPFKITSTTTGESHVVVTDENGVFDTSSAWNPHSQNTNRGQTAYDGVWFGDISVLDDSLGALPYDTYIIEELPCEANTLYELFEPFEVSVYRNSVVVDLGTLTNDYIVVPKLRTTATYANTDLHDAYIGVETTIVDTVDYTDVEIGQEYTLVGVLMDKATGEPVLVDGEEVTASTTFTAKWMTGSVDVVFNFNSVSLSGKNVVVFQKLYADGVEVASHEDIEDEGQTITFIPPEIGTTAHDETTGNHSANVSKRTTIIDTVQYSGLQVGQEYTVSGILVLKSTGEPLLVDGEEITASETFVAESSSGTIDLAFTFNSSALQGEVVVVFETLYIEDIEVAAHTDISDFEQSIAFGVPFIGTTAKDSLTLAGHAYIQQETTFVDTVKYTGLSTGDEYTLVGVLMDKATGKELLVDGKPMTSSTTFTAPAGEGSTEVAFAFPSSALRGKDVVVFEKLYLDELEIASHEDIADEGQTVQFLDPEIGTTAVDRATGNHTADTSKQTIIVDTVTYKGLKVGDEYTVEGVLMDKATGKELLIGGEPVTASATFTAKTADGSIELEFIFDSSGLEEQAVVVFESLYYKELEIAVHANISDEGQTVTFNKAPEPPKTEVPATGDPGKNAFILSLVLSVAALAGLAVFINQRKKKQ